jgi:alkanesulfonate monooxygenase SsuD/methylene tetrahydromethanopterin reductase-like flavin-dependent oxidoreductase (luciferase family)
MSRWLGIHLLNHGEMSPGEMLELISLADEKRYDGLSINEDVGHEAVGILAVAADRTDQIELGTAITNVYSRSAMQIAMGAATIDEISGGRFALGLSVGHHPWNDEYHGIPLERAPLARLKEYTQFIRGVLAGGRYEHDGVVYQGVSTKLEGKFRKATVPIRIAGDRGGVLRAAGQLADGAITNAVSSNYLAEFAVDRFFSSAVEAGRDPETLDFTVIVTCCLTDDRDAALRNARAAFIERVERNPEQRLATRTGVEREEVQHLSELIKAGHRDRALEEVSESLITSTVALGNAADVKATVERFYAAGATHVMLASSPRDPASTRALIESLAPLRDAANG